SALFTAGGLGFAPDRFNLHIARSVYDYPDLDGDDLLLLRTLHWLLSALLGWLSLLLFGLLLLSLLLLSLLLLRLLLVHLLRLAAACRILHLLRLDGRGAVVPCAARIG